MAINPEQYLISAVLNTEEFIPVLTEGVNSNLFHTFQDEMKFIEDFISKNKTVPSKIIFKNRYPEFSIKDSKELKHFTDEVRKTHIRFVLATGIEKTIEYLKNEQPDVAMSKLYKQLTNLSIEIDGNRSEAEIISETSFILSEVEERIKNSQLTGIPGIHSGFKTLDENTGGFNKGDIALIASRRGHGKTFSMIRWAVEAVLKGKTVHYHSLEQTKDQLTLRAHSILSFKTNHKIFRTMDLNQGRNFNFQDYKDFVENLCNKVHGKLYISDTTRGQVSPLTIAAKQEANSADIIFVDYLTLMQQEGDDWRATAKLSGEMKQLAQRYKVPIVCGAQINRTGEGKEPPGSGTLGYSDAIEQDADEIITMAQQSKHCQKYRMIKYRHGIDGWSFFTKFNPNNGEIEEVTGNEAQTIIDQDLVDS